MTIDPSVTVHATALVDQGATVGAGSRIWHWAHICAGAVIGDGCSFGQNVFVGNAVRIGNNVKVQNNVSVYDNVILEDDVFCGPSMVFTNVYNPRSAVSRRDQYRTTWPIWRNVGGQLHRGLWHNDWSHAFIGAGAVVNRDVKPFALMVGVPAKQIGWMSAYGERVDLPVEGRGAWNCPHTGDHYELEGGLLSHTPNCS